MAVDERNFRSAYYEKVGFKSVEEKRSLEIILKETDVTKLKQFCLRFCVPYTHRNLVWKLLLGVLPKNESCREFVHNCRREEYSNLMHALDVMRVTQNSPKFKVILAAWLLKQGRLQSISHCETQAWLKPICSIVKTMNFYFDDDDVDVYWFSTVFYEVVMKFQCELPKLIEETHNLLEKEDFELYKHLVHIEALDTLPFASWYECCFAGILDDAILGRLWDKIVGGSYKILIYASVVMLITLKKSIIKCKNVETVLEYIKKLSGKQPEIILNKTLELWQQQGSPLTAYDKPKP